MFASLTLLYVLLALVALALMLRYSLTVVRDRSFVALLYTHLFMWALTLYLILIAHTQHSSEVGMCAYTLSRVCLRRSMQSVLMTFAIAQLTQIIVDNKRSLIGGCAPFNCNNVVTISNIGRFLNLPIAYLAITLTEVH